MNDDKLTQRVRQGNRPVQPRLFEDVRDATGKLTVKRISNAEAHDLILDVHYAHRLPSISYAFGLLNGQELLGVVTFGSPVADPVRKGLLGPELSDRVLELNRLVLRDNTKNHASYLVARALRELPEGTAVLSFADTDQGHVGTVYQAANFIYCGLSAKRTDWRVEGMEHLHGHTIADMFRGHPNRAQAARERFGERFSLADRSRKHRYVYFVGGKRTRKELAAALKYDPQPYPKAAS